jgi:hypothetical protein
MIETCGAITPEEMVAYWTNDLATTDLDRLDEHLMSCEICSAASARVSVLAAAMRAIIPPFLDHAALASLRARGYRIKENPIRPDDRRPVVFEASTDLLIHRLERLDLADATEVAVVISVEDTGAVILDEPNVPFDRDTGEVLIACQRHFASFPPNVVAEVRIRRATGSESRSRYPIPHVFERRASE